MNEAISFLTISHLRVKSGSDTNLAERLARLENVLALTVARNGERNPPPTFSPDASTPVSSVTTRSASRAPKSLGEQFAAYELKHPVLATPPSCNKISRSLVDEINYAGCYLGQVTCPQGEPLFSEAGKKWIFSKTGERAPFRKLMECCSRQESELSSLSIPSYRGSPEDLYELPERAIVDKAVDWFSQSAFRLVFPAVDRVLFRDTVSVAYEPWKGVPSLEQLSAKGCVLAFLSIVCTIHEAAAGLPMVDGDACAIKAHHLLTDMLEGANLVCLQTVFMLAMHQTFSGRLQAAAMFHSVAYRLIFMLGGHLNMDVKPFGAEVTRQERETRHLRMLFWLCYILDKDISLRAGQPPMIDDDYCDLTLPDGYLESRFSLAPLGDDFMSPSYADDSLVPYLPGDLRLSKLKSKVSRVLYSFQALRKSDTEVLRLIRELDDELENWRISIPQAFRPTLSISENFRLVPELKLPQSMQRIGLHLEYHHLLASIHRASGRCNTGNPNSDPQNCETRSCIKSSMALALEASRSTLYYLRAAVDGLASEAFWVMVFYPTSAINTLFFNILINPLDPQAKADLELLSSAVDLIRSMPIRRLTPYEIGHIKMVDDFVAELLHLGNCAISRARREKGQQALPIIGKEVGRG